jgi:LysM repeat protein
MNARKWMVALSLALLVLLSFNVSAFAAPAYPMPGPAGYYVVRPGDTLFSIAMRYNTNVWVLARANGILNPSVIFGGQVLVIPAAGPMPGPLPGPIVRPFPSQVVHVVRWGENLYGIAAMYGVNAWSIARANGLANPNYIFTGERLLIPVPTPVYYSGPMGNGSNYPTVYPYSNGYGNNYGTSTGYGYNNGYGTPGTPAGYGY